MISEKLNQQLTLSFPVNTEKGEGLSENSENLERVEKKSLVEFIREDLSEKLHLPEYYLYSLVLEYLESEDLVEVRKQFKQVLVLEKRERGMEVGEVSEDQVSKFLNPEDPNLKLERSGLLLQRTRDRIRESLECESPLSFLEIQREVVTEMVQEEACLEVQPLSKEYFETPELVRRDLEEFAGFIEIGKYAKEKSVKYLSTRNPNQGTKIQLSNGDEKSWQAYLNTVARVMGFLSDQGILLKKKTLDYLLELVGAKEEVTVELNREYFENVEWVRQDLEGFAGFIEIGRRAKEKSVKYLSTENPSRSTKIKLWNGEEENWPIYLNTVARVMEFFKESGRPDQKRALGYLLELTGVKEEVTVELNREYFENTEWVRQDLEGFAEFIKIGRRAKEKSVKYLSTENPSRSTKIKLWNGEDKSWQAYLITVARVMGFLNDKGQPIKKKALNYLLELTGVKEKATVELNREYFENVEWVKQDLEGFAGFIEDRKNHEVEKVIGNLSTANPDQGTKIKLSNGDEKTWVTYLNTVARVMGFFTESGNPDQKRALDYLLELTGVKEKVTVELNREYFENVEWVRQDLEGFAWFIEIGRQAKKRSVKYLSTGNPKWGTEVRLSNGEERSWQTYLNTVARVMGFLNNKGQPIKKKALDYLKSLVLENQEKDEGNENLPEEDLEKLLTSTI